MNEKKAVLLLLAVCTAGTAFAQSVSIGTNSVRVVFSCPPVSETATNGMLEALSGYLGGDRDFSGAFVTSRDEPTAPAPLRTGFPEYGPPEEVAGDIELDPRPPCRITVGEEAVSWLTNCLERISEFSGATSSARAFLESLASGSITNDMETARSSFAVNGEVVSDADRDGELVRGIAGYWSALRVNPPCLFDWRPGPLAPGGDVLPGFAARFSDPDTGDVVAQWIVFLDGRWRVALFE